MTKNKTEMQNETNIRLFPTVRRMRDFHVYDYKGARYLDLYRLNGHALMGHKPGRLSLVLKNAAAKGLFASYPSIYEERLQKALRLLLPECTEFRIYRNRERLMAVLSDVLGKPVSPADPLYPSHGEVLSAYWRPFLKDVPISPVTIPVLPVPGDFFPWVAGFTRGFDQTMPISDTVSPVLLGMVTRSIHDLLLFGTGYNEEIWKKFPLPFWNRRGPYLTFSGSAESYLRVFQNCRDQGILLSPEAGKPSIIPGEWTEGEIQFLGKR